MTFAADEKTIHDGQRRTLYDFVLQGGDAAAYYLTSHDQSLSVLSQTYTPATIRHGKVTAVGSGRANEMIVTCAYNLAIVDELMLKQPPRSVLLTIRRYHGDIANVSKVWEGQVRSCRVRGLFAELRVPSTLMEALEAEVPSVNAQGMCNHVLYNTRCGVTRASFTTSTTVSTIDANDARIVTVASLGGAADQVFRGGEIERTSDGERRLIVDQTGTVLTLNRAFRNLAVTDAVDVSQGCDHTIATCDTKFSNKANFGGMPFIPVKNLFRVGVPV